MSLMNHSPAAEWSIRTGYVAVSPAAYKTPAMEKYAKEFPAVKLVSADALGGWDIIAKEHLAPGGILDQVYVGR